MAKNDFIRKRNDRDQAFFDAGERIGMQKMWDYVQLCLRDPVVVGKDTFGKERMRKLFYRIKDRVDYYHPAFTDDVEADFRQAQMDRELEEIWGDELSPFYERYSELKRFKYDKPKKGWLDLRWNRQDGRWERWDMADISRSSRLNPCMGCPDRYPACSDHCQNPEFKAYKAEQEKIKENRRKYWSPIWKRGEGRYR